MNCDFYDAHQRHWDDAEQLYTAERWANADQLYGLAAECGLKKLMLLFGMPFDSVRDSPQNFSDRVHANGAWDRYETYRSGHHAGTHYGIAEPNPFADWDISQRYANQSLFDMAYVNPHKFGAKKVNEMIKKAMLEGLI
jgi:hypothetical protein